MKIQCDVCGKDGASVFCTADEAALCGGCDHHVHHANKLASKHQRFSLLSPSSKDFPLCDICQEKRALLFCQQDRAVLCRECDVPIHAATEHTQWHNRFLLTGVKLFATSALYTSASHPPAASLGSATVPDFKTEASSVRKSSPASAPSTARPPRSVKTAASAGYPAAAMTAVGEGNGSTSSISEYLIETLPGWHFEDFLDSCSASFGFCKNEGDESMSSSTLSSSESSHGIWVPQAPPPIISSSITAISQFSANGLKQAEITKLPSTMKLSNNKMWSGDDIFAVPQIIFHPSSGLKRCKHLY